LQAPWRWDWKENEHRVNGAGLCNCTEVAPGLPGGSPVVDGICCFPYLTGNAPFPACQSNGIGLYHHVDLQHILADPLYEAPPGSSAPRAVALDAKAAGLTGTLSGPQVRPRS